jgi:hypothetical protein
MATAIVKYKQDKTLKGAYEILCKNKITVKHSRMDYDSFDRSVSQVVEASSTDLLHQGTTVCQPLRYGEGNNLLGSKINRGQRIPGDIH